MWYLLMCRKTVRAPHESALLFLLFSFAANTVKVVDRSSSIISNGNGENSERENGDI